METNNVPTMSAFTVGGSLVGEGIINYKETNNMNTTNNASQTLFRFVSVRSPQLSDEKDQEKRFILAPQALKEDDTFYLPVVNGTGSKQKLLQTYAANYANNPKCISSDRNSANNLKRFKSNYPEISDFATWLAKNKSTCTYTELKSKKSELFEGKIIENPEIDLWNNLIYQTVTQKDFYIKETIMQMLLALHVLPVANEDQSKALLGARVVLPKELMLDDESLPSSQIASKMAVGEIKETYPTEEMKKQQLISVAKTKLEKYESLQKNLSTLERQYQTEYQKEYKIQDESYQEKNRPALEEYYSELARVKEEFCAIRKPDVKYDPADPCQQPKEVPYPDIPAFDFSFRPEISADELNRSLKPENMDALLDVLGYEFNPESANERSITDSENIEYLLEGKDTFAEINTLIKESIDKANAVIVENTEGSNEVYTSIGGVMMPLAKTTAVAYTYQICPKAVYKLFNLDLSLNVPDSSWEVSGVSYALFGNGINVDGFSYVKSRTGNTIFLNDLLGQGVEFSTMQDSSFEIKVYFTNGKIAQFKTLGINVRTCISSKFELLVDEGEPPVIIDDENHFIPSGFGFKQIGIADYLKVEQSTHAYVEGEVAHIENVMAREYREKSTRRLRRSENTTTTSSDTEREQLSDTTTANRFEMQNEIAKIMQEASDNGTQFNVATNYKMGDFNINTGLGLNNAHHSSKEESTRQAMTQAQEVTSRAMDRIVTKVHEERIEKIIDEFEENNSHGLDNRKGDKHVVGVYRWVDKLMKNQIYNYGKRLMFEFMVPEPAKLHLLWVSQNKAASTLVKPEDPRTSVAMPMKDFTALGTDSILKYWISKYNVEIENLPTEVIKVTKGFAYGRDKVADVGASSSTTSAIGMQDVVKIPEGYVSTNYAISGGGKEYEKCLLNINIADMRVISNSSSQTFVSSGAFSGYSGDVAVSISTDRFYSFETSLSITCQLTSEARKQWQQKTFKAIIEAYEEALIEYNNAVSEEQNKAVEIKGSNPNFYRQIENTVLRKNCISYIVDRNAGSTHGYGLEGLTQGSSFSDYETVLSSNLDNYTAYIKFMEQAFEWENLSYYLYPYYWGRKTNWNDLYQSDDTDPLFKAFLQSGMARVVATVRPGFEDAVQFYMATGKIWNGAEVPVIGDDLYLSIVDEMKEPKGEKQGKAWLTRLPTALNILQAESIGLKVAHALPFTAEDPNDFEVPSEVITEDKFNFEKNDSLLGGGATEKWIEISSRLLDSTSEYGIIQNFDDSNLFPRIYKCMGSDIEINRDAQWEKTDSSLVLYNAIADELSKIDGIQAFPSGENGLTFRIDITKIKHFKFAKPPHYSPEMDTIEFLTDGESFLKFSGDFINSAFRIMDKNGKKITKEEYVENIPLSRFLI